jgi:cytidylate kinase
LRLRERLIITIDGPSGAGKSTVAKKVADRLGYAYLDTGAMYRAVAYAYASSDQQGIVHFLKTLKLTFSFDHQVKVFLYGEEISSRIRSSEISLAASRLSQDPDVRTYCTNLQRTLGEDGGVVVEGRDTGSVVFPHADRKFYLDADMTERARRRHVEVTSSKAGQDESFEKVQAEMEKRDHDDSARALAPLVRPEGAFYIDTTNKSIDEVVELLIEAIGKEP